MRCILLINSPFFTVNIKRLHIIPNLSMCNGAIGLLAKDFCAYVHGQNCP